MTATLTRTPASAETAPRRHDDDAVAGPPPRARWELPALLGLLGATAVLYLVGLSASGYANEFYAAAVQAGTKNLTAWLFGSLDAGNSITVDKPPASLWIMVLSARLLGFSSFSLLLPQALMGVATVGITYAAVRRWAGGVAGLVAGALVALTPVAALMFRFDNPDAFLVLMMTLAGYGVVRAVDATHAVDEGDRSGARRAVRWLVLAGLAIGIAFLTKLFQGLLVLPAFALVYVVAAKLDLRRRILHLIAALGAVVVGAGWFVALVELWPASARPYIGGSTDNSLWELAIGYNGLGRIFGGSGNGGGGGGGQNTGFGGSTGLGRLFNTAFGSEISWFLPAALIGLVAVLLLGRKAIRTDRTRAGLILWGGSLVVSGLVFSFMQGTIHPYYAVALAPSIAATVAIAGAALWRRRDETISRVVLAVMIAATAVWSFVLLADQAPSWLPWLRYAVVVGGLLGAGLLVAATGRLRRLAVVALLVGGISAGAGSAAWTVATASQAHSGSIPTSGPAGVASSGFGGGGTRGGAQGGFGGGTAPTGTPPSGGSAPTGQGGPGGSSSTSGSTTSGSPSGTSGTTSGTSDATSGSTGSTDATSGTTSGTASGSTSGSTSSSSLTALLSATTTTWSAATTGSQTAAGYELSSGTSVMAIGGWDGSDPSITLAQFKADVANGKITYFIAGGGQGGGGGQSGSSTVASQITSWVESTYTATTVGGTTVYDLTAS